MALHQCLPTTKNEFFDWKEHSCVEIKRLSRQISSFRSETYYFFLTNVHLTVLLHYRIQGFQFEDGIISSEFVSKWSFSFERAAMKTQSSTIIWKAALAPFATSNYASVSSTLIGLGIVNLFEIIFDISCFLQELVCVFREPIKFLRYFKNSHGITLDSCVFLK